MDVVWTPRGNMTYTTMESKTVVKILESGKVVTYTQMLNPFCLSVSYDDIIFLVDWKAGIYQSTDDGDSWSLVFRLNQGGLFIQFFKLRNSHQTDEEQVYHKTNDFLALEISQPSFNLCIYNMDKGGHKGNVTWRTVNFNTTSGRQIDLRFSHIFYDNYQYIFMTDYVYRMVHVLTTNGTYHSQFLSSAYIKNKPMKLIVDSANHLLFVGQEKGAVAVFKLIFTEMVS